MTENEFDQGSPAPTLAETVLGMVETDESLPDDVELLIFAALDGDALLAEVLGRSAISRDDVRALLS